MRGWTGRLFDAAVAAAVAAGSVFFVLVNATECDAAVTGLVMAVALWWRRRYPLLVLGVVATTALVRFVLSPDVPLVPHDVGVLIAVYSVVKYAERLRDGYLAAAVVAAGIVLQVLTIKVDGAGRISFAVILVVVCAGVWLSGLTVRTRRRYLAGLEERAAALQRERDALARVAAADERAATARELHDIVAHGLAVMIVQADAASYVVDRDPDAARAALGTVAATGREALDDMRRLVGVLRDSADAAPGGPGGAGGGVPDGADDGAPRRPPTVGDLVARARSAGLAVELTISGDPALSPPAVDLTVCRVVREALTNVLRHAGAGCRAAVQLTYRPDAVELRVEDDGAGVPVGDRSSSTDGYGLRGMGERISVHGGELRAGPRSGGGWRVTARVPVRA